MSPQWGQATRQWVTVVLFVLAAITLYLLRPLIPPLALAVLLAYMLNPIVDALGRRTRLPRVLSTILVYLVLIVLLSLTPILIVPQELLDSLSRVQIDLRQALESLRQTIAAYGTFQVAGYVIDPALVYQLAMNNLEQSLSKIAPRSVNIFFGVATGFATTVLWIFFILVISFYLVKDSPAILRYLDSQIPERHRDEVWSLVYRIGDTWHAFLRGQLLLGLTVGITVGVSMAVLGVRNATVLGILAGLLEIVPNIGPALAAVPAILIALFQGSSHFVMPNTWFTVIVIATYFVIQQIENNVFVPRIIGRSLDLHPVVVLIGAIVGASVAGILGMFLAAPTIATLRVLTGYAYGKLLESAEDDAHRADREPSVAEAEPEVGDDHEEGEEQLL
jgi:predicted PurR-regulated permease PerM